MEPQRLRGSGTMVVLRSTEEGLQRRRLPEPRLPGRDASPVLDIGGEVGALVVYLDTRPATGELEACPTSDLDARFHTGVHNRYIGGVFGWVALFPEVSEGTYYLLGEDDLPMCQTTVAGGQVTKLDLRHPTNLP